MHKPVLVRERHERLHVLRLRETQKWTRCSEVLLRLDLHVYAANPQDRFALINMHKMHEGDSLADGVHVDNITPDGVILSRNGLKFLLPRD